MFWSSTEFFHNNIKVITDARLSKYLRNIKTTLPPLTPVLALDLMWIQSQGYRARARDTANTNIYQAKQLICWYITSTFSCYNDHIYVSSIEVLPCHYFSLMYDHYLENKCILTYNNQINILSISVLSCLYSSIIYDHDLKLSARVTK